MNARNDLSRYPGQIGACLEAAIQSMEGISTFDDPARILHRVQHATWLIEAAAVINEKLSNEDSLS